MVGLALGNSGDAKSLFNRYQIGQIKTFQFATGDANDGIGATGSDTELLEPRLDHLAIAGILIPNHDKMGYLWKQGFFGGADPQ